MVDHIHLDKKYIQHTLPIKEQYAKLDYLLFLIVTVYIYISKLINYKTQNSKEVVSTFLECFSTHA